MPRGAHGRALLQGLEPDADSVVMAKKKEKALRVYRDTGTGRFVTKKYAKKNPKTTAREKRPAGGSR